MKNCTTGIPCYSLNGKKQSTMPADEILVPIELGISDDLDKTDIQAHLYFC